MIPLIPAQTRSVWAPAPRSGVPVVVVWVMAALLAVAALAIGGLVAKVGNERHRVQVVAAQARDAQVRAEAAAADAQAAEATAVADRERAEKSTRALAAAQGDVASLRTNQAQMLTCVSELMGSYTSYINGYRSTAQAKWFAVRGTCKAAIGGVEVDEAPSIPDGI